MTEPIEPGGSDAAREPIAAPDRLPAAGQSIVAHRAITAPATPCRAAAQSASAVAGATGSNTTAAIGARWHAPMQGATTTRTPAGAAWRAACSSGPAPAIMQGRPSQTRSVTGGGAGASSGRISKWA